MESQEGLLGAQVRFKDGAYGLSLVRAIWATGSSMYFLVEVEETGELIQMEAVGFVVVSLAM